MIEISDLISKFYLGIDESNHGRFDEIFTLAYSENPKFATYVKKELSKKRHHDKTFLEEISNLGIEYSFLLLSQESSQRIPEMKLPGVIAASLITGVPKSNLEIFIDGKLSAQQELFMYTLLSKKFSLGEDSLKIISGDKYDEHYRIVNFADELAHYFFRKSLEDLNLTNNNSHRKELLIDLAA